jgi:hypothetical protein
VGGEAPVTPVSSLDSSSLNLSYKPCDNRFDSTHVVEGVGWVRFQLESRGYLEVAKVLLVPDENKITLSVIFGGRWVCSPIL